MSLRIVGYRNGQRIVIDDGPSRARVSGYGQGNLHSLTLIGGDLVQREPGVTEKERAAQRDYMRRARHKE